MFIYALKDPRTDEIRYIGKTSRSVNQRLRQHLCRLSKTDETHKANWIRTLVAQGLRPEVETIMTCDTKDELNQAEIFCIGFARDIGLPLTNGTDGGDGGATCRGHQVSKEIRQKISAAQKGKPKWTAEQRQEMSLKRRGKSNLTPEQQARAAASRVGKHPTPETREKLSAWQRNKPKSTEHREKISQTLRKRAQKLRDVSTLNPQGMWDKVG